MSNALNKQLAAISLDFFYMVDWDFTFSALYMFAYRKKFNQMDQVG